MKIRFYNNDIQKFIKSLDKKTIARILRTLDLLEDFGYELKMPHSKYISEGIFELRIKSVQHVRLFYVFYDIEVVIILHGFIKTGQKIPQKDWNTAVSRNKLIDKT